MILRSRACLSLQTQEPGSQFCKPVIKYAVPLGINRCGSFTLLSAILYIYIYNRVFCPRAGLFLQTQIPR